MSRLFNSGYNYSLSQINTSLQLSSYAIYCIGHAILCEYFIYSYVAGFEKSWLPDAQQKKSHFPQLNETLHNS